MFRTRGYRVDPFRYTIRRGDHQVSLEPKVMRVLVLFLERPGRVISKQQLLRDVWEGSFVSDDVVTAAVYQIRKAFGERASRPRFLETVHRRGYRWSAPVTRWSPPLDTSRWKSTVAAAMVVAALGWMGWSAARWRAMPSEPSREALSAYAKGRYFLDQRRPEAMRLAMRSFQEAFRRAPGWSAALAGLADTLTLQVDLGMAASTSVEGDARRLAERALQLDRASAEAWTSVALTHLLFDFDFASAEAAFQRSLDLDPESAFAHQAYAWHLSARGELEDAMEHARQATLLAPTLISPRLDFAFILGLARRHDDAVRQLESALELDGTRAEAYAALGWAHTLAGRDQQGLVAFRRSVTLSGGREPSEMSRLLEQEGVRGFFRFALAREGSRLGWTAKARLHAVLGEAEDALACLEKAYHERDTAVLWVEADPVFSALEHDERFRALVRQRL